MKKIISVLTAIVMVLCVAAPVAFAATPAVETKLQFNEDGTFKIMNLSDIQDGTSLMSLSADFIDAAIEAEQPDLIVLTGDNIAGGSAGSLAKTEKAIDQFMSILEKHGIPVAVTFGNHDAEGNAASREEQMAIYQQYSCFIGVDDGEEIDHCGTYSIPVYSSTNPNDVEFNVWMFDTGSYDENGQYDHVKQSQLDWYKEESTKLKLMNGGSPVPSIAFQHIIVPEIFDALVEVSSDTEGAVAKYGKYYVLPETAAEGSFLGEAPCPSGINGGQFETLVAGGDVMAIVSGHDHTNSFVVPYKGIDIINTPTCGFRSYGSSESRGIRIFTVDENKPFEYETRILTFQELFADDTLTMLKHNIVSFFTDLVAYFNNLYVKISSMLGINM